MTKADESVISELEALLENRTFDDVLNSTVGRYVQDKAYTLQENPNK